MVHFALGGDTRQIEKGVHDATLFRVTEQANRETGQRYLRWTFLIGDVTVDAISPIVFEPWSKAYHIARACGARPGDCDTDDLIGAEVSVLVEHDERYGPTIVEVYDGRT